MRRDLAADESWLTGVNTGRAVFGGKSELATDGPGAVALMVWIVAGEVAVLPHSVLGVAAVIMYFVVLTHSVWNVVIMFGCL